MLLWVPVGSCGFCSPAATGPVLVLPLSMWLWVPVVSVVSVVIEPVFRITGNDPSFLPSFLPSFFRSLSCVFGNFMNRVLEVQPPTVGNKKRQYQSKHYTASEHNIGFVRSTLNLYSKIYDHDLRY